MGWRDARTHQAHAGRAPVPALNARARATGGDTDQDRGVTYGIQSHGRSILEFFEHAPLVNEPGCRAALLAPGRYPGRHCDSWKPGADVGMNLNCPDYRLVDKDIPNGDFRHASAPCRRPAGGASGDSAGGAGQRPRLRTGGGRRAWETGRAEFRNRRIDWQPKEN